MSERGCTDVCGQCGRKGKVRNGWGGGPVGMSELGCADVCGWCGCKLDARRCVDGVDARERVEMGGEKDRWA